MGYFLNGTPCGMGKKVIFSFHFTDSHRHHLKSIIMTSTKKWNRRQFIGSATAASVGFTLVPRHVLGGKGFTAPSDKLTLAYIGCGTQGLREMCELIKHPKIQIVSVCDPNKMSTNYVDWSPFGIRNLIRETLGNNSWGENYQGIPGGRDIGQEVVNAYYQRALGTPGYSGCTAYEDFRDLLEKEKDIDAVKVMTPDHLHAHISIAAMKKGKQVVIHKPIANRLYEALLSIRTAKETGAGTHLLAWAQIPGLENIQSMLQSGAIGKLKEIHNWSNRPVWQQWTQNPKETQPVPEGMNWELWLGPVPDRPYHINYTHCVFRGWYDFGGGSIADMGHYSLWPLFLKLGITNPPLSAEASGTTTSETVNQISTRINNNVAFPFSSTVKFKFPSQPTLPAFDLYWYDGGIRPATPEELDAENKSLPVEGLMLVGDRGKILAGFRGEQPRLFTDQRNPNKQQNTADARETPTRSDDVWIDAFLKKTPSPGNFGLAQTVTETILLGSVAIRSGKKINYDSKQMKITNHSEANQYFYREYRKGWEL